MIVKGKVTYDHFAGISALGTEKEPLMEQGQDVLVFSPKPEDELAQFLDRLIDACNFKAPEVLAPTIANEVGIFRNKLADAIRRER